MVHEILTFQAGSSGPQEVAASSTDYLMMAVL